MCWRRCVRAVQRLSIRGTKPRDRSGTLASAAASNTHLHFLCNAKTSHATSNERWSAVEARRVHHLAEIFNNKNNFPRDRLCSNIQIFTTPHFLGPRLGNVLFSRRRRPAACTHCKPVVPHDFADKDPSAIDPASAFAFQRLSSSIAQVVASCLDALRPVILQDFVDKEDLALCLKASANIPVIAGSPMHHRCALPDVVPSNLSRQPQLAPSSTFPAVCGFRPKP